MFPAPRRSASASAALAGLLAATGCPVDDDRPDAAPPADATEADADPGNAGPSRCPGQTFYEVHARDWDTSEGLADVEVSEAGAEDNRAFTGPGGGAVLCLPEDGARVRHAGEDTLPWLAAVDGEAAERLAGAGVAFRAHVLAPAQADDVFARDLGRARDPAAAQVIVEVRVDPGDDAPVGTDIDLADAAYGAVYTGSPGETFTPGSALDADALAFFANVAPGNGEASVELALPPAYEDRCAGPESAPLRENAFTYARFSCEPSSP